MPDAAPGVDWTQAHTWEFFPLDDEVFPAVRLAREVGAAGGTAPAVYNAANEECVGAFLAGRLRVHRDCRHGRAGSFRAHEQFRRPDVSRGGLTLDDVLAADGWARTRARELTAG